MAHRNCPHIQSAIQKLWFGSSDCEGNLSLRGDERRRGASGATQPHSTMQCNFIQWIGLLFCDISRLKLNLLWLLAWPIHYVGPLRQLWLWGSQIFWSESWGMVFVLLPDITKKAAGGDIWLQDGWYKNRPLFNFSLAPCILSCIITSFSDLLLLRPSLFSTDISYYLSIFEYPFNALS